MAITVTHPFVSAKGDGSDATLLRPSNWNAIHTVNMATSKIIGRLTAGTGAAEELSVTAYMIGLLNTADFAALAAALGLPTTGDAKLTFKTVQDPGWVMMNDGSIGDVGSGSTTMASSAAQALFTLGYSVFTDAAAPIQTSAGVPTTRAAQVNAATAWANKCRMLLPRALGRAIIIGGTGSGLTARALGSWAGEESHILTTTEMPQHSHTFTGGALSGTSISGTATGSCSTTIAPTNTSFPDAIHTHNLTVSNAITGTAREAAGISHDHTSNAPTKTLYTGSGADGPFGFPQAATAATIDTANTDHTHFFSINSQTSAPQGGGYGDGSHKHTFGGTFGGTSSLNTWTGVTVSGTCNGSIANSGLGGAHNVMQPWTAWNVMIKL